MSRVRLWVGITRPRTLPAAAAPVLMGAALAWRGDGLHVPAVLGALLGALLLQVGANIANDYFDGIKGTDTPQRLGPQRATASGLVPPATMWRAFVLVFALATLVGAGLTMRAGWPVVVIGVAAVAAAVLYTGGPRPLGYLGLGDVLVLVFFGPVAVAGTVYVSTLTWRADAWVAGLAPGALAVALLALNNLRDVGTDRATGKGTLAVRFGPGFARGEIALGLLVAAAVPVVLVLACDAPPTLLAAAVVPLLGVRAARRAFGAAPGDRLLDALAALGRLLAVYGVVFALALVVGPR